MAVQFDVYRTPTKSLVVIVQNDLLDEFKVRVVIPLFPSQHYGDGAGSLNPELSIDGDRYVLMTEYIASLTIPELGERVGNISRERDRIVRAVDTLLAGV